ncbi:MAG TPA: IPT/TIG domain-containing protein, partial [Verrucomicrobiae bacterium]|nr:IPT/TIG domain-containing protein [Verrucomicrobiae bacterium]
MQRTLRLLFTLLLLAPAARGAAIPPPPPPAQAPSPPAIVSIVPSQGEPGGRITLFGSGFAEGSQAVLGQSAAETSVLDERQLQFDIPQLAPGLYALYVRTPQGLLSKAYNFTVSAPRPAAVSLEPESVYSCSSGEARRVTVRGR